MKNVLFRRLAASASCGAVSLMPAVLLLVAAVVMAAFIHEIPSAGAAQGLAPDVPELSAAVKSRPAPAEGLVSHDAGNSEELVSLLKDERLWEAREQGTVPPVLIRSFPADFSRLAVERKKRAFIHSLLPVVMVAVDEIKAERRRLMSALGRLGEDPASVEFTADDSAWQATLGPAQAARILRLCEKYRSRNGAELLRRVDTLPASLVIAQAAMESSWGGSRFASQANNLFGMWTWSGKGIVPNRRDPGKTHRIAVYDTILDSVRAYLLTINRLPAYARLRQIRTRTHDPIALAEGLIRYSEKGAFYVADIKRIIRFNNLTGYDKLRLAAG